MVSFLQIPEDLKGFTERYLMCKWVEIKNAALGWMFKEEGKWRSV